MHNLELKFEGSPFKFGKAAFCDLVYTQSKLYDHVLYKDLLYFKDISHFKSESLALAALNQHLEDKYANALLQKNTIIDTQKQEIHFLKENNRLMANKNLERTKKIVKDHQKHIQSLLIEKEQETFFIQGQKELLERKIQQLELQLSKNIAVVSNIAKERQEHSKKLKHLQKESSGLQFKIQELQKTNQQLERDHKSQIKKSNDEKLQIELHFKKLMLQRSQDFKLEFQQLENIYLKKIQLQDQQQLNASLAAKEILNRTIINYQSQLDSARQNSNQLQDSVQKLTNQLEIHKARTLALESDVRKQDEILDKYEIYLKQSDANVISLKELLLQCQEELQKAKVSLEKNKIQRDSFQNRIQICEEEARMWRESYYLNKSRAINDN